MRILVAISSFGTSQDQYLLQMIEEYRSMPFDLDIVVLSNIPKEVAPGVEVIVGLPDEKDPWSLVYAHKSLFAKRAEDYDLFIHTENDILITESHIRSFLKVSAVLHDDEITGFMRFEAGPDGETNFPDVHASFHWDGRSVVTRGEYTLAYFTNEQAACYLLTREQLRRAIHSGGYVVAPHLGKYGICESAATDPYTQCGFKKLICISHVDEFLVHHMSNKYVKKVGIERPEFQILIDALMEIGKNALCHLFPVSDGNQAEARPLFQGLLRAVTVGRRFPGSLQGPKRAFPGMRMGCNGRVACQEGSACCGCASGFGYFRLRGSQGTRNRER